jgi:hypothetical protein
MTVPLSALKLPGSAVAMATLLAEAGAVETCSLIVTVPHAADTRAAEIRAILRRTMLSVY